MLTRFLIDQFSHSISYQSRSPTYICPISLNALTTILFPYPSIPASLPLFFITPILLPQHILIIAHLFFSPTSFNHYITSLASHSHAYLLTLIHQTLSERVEKSLRCVLES